MTLGPSGKKIRGQAVSCRPPERILASNRAPKPAARQQIQALLAEKESRTPTQLKIDSVVLRAVRESRGQPMAAGVTTLVPVNLADSSGAVVLDLKATVSADLLKQVATLGGQVVAAYPGAKSVRVRLPIAQVEALAAHSDVLFVGRKDEAALEAGPLPAGLLVSDRPDLPAGFGARAERVQAQLRSALVTVRPLVGSTQSEGDATHQAALARSTYGYDGTGIRIGVLSDSVDGLANSQAAGNLGAVTVLPGQSGVPGSGEGTAMLEIVHDIAPGAQLFFATAFGGVPGFAANIQALRNAPYNCDIIVDDVFYFSESPFQDAPIAQAVNTVTAAGALYFSSAGNAGNATSGTSGVWEGDFVNGGPVAAPVTGTGNLHSFGVNTYDTVSTSSGRVATLFWSDALGASANDYDLFVLNSAGTTVTDSSTNAQTGTQDPFEQTAASPAAATRLVIVQRSGAANRYLHLNTNRGVLATATGGQTKGHNSAVAAFGTAATPATSPGPYPGPFTTANTIETFSSDGPRRMFYDATGTPYTPGNFSSTGGTVRSKPDITAADGVTTSVSGFAPFYGTSAAAPHAAAIAALLKQAGPALTPAAIRTTLASTALDIMAAGTDVNSGAGIVMPTPAIATLAPTPVGNVFIQSYVAAEGALNNGNGWLDPGENMLVTVTLQNGGAASDTSVSGTLSLATPVAGVNVTVPGPVTFGTGTIVAGATADNASSKFGLHLGSSVPCGQQLDLNLNLAYGGGAPGSSPVDLGFSVKTGPPPVTVSTTLDTTAPPAGPSYTAATGTTTAGRLFRDGIASTCAAPKATCPGTSGSGTRRYDAYTFTNTAPVAQCVIVTATNACTGTTNAMFYVAYLTSFDPASQCTNYLADAGSSQTGGAAQSFSFNVAAGATYVIVVEETSNPGAAAASCGYTLKVDNALYCTEATPVELHSFQID